MSLPLHRSSAALPVVTGFASVPPLLQDSWYTNPKDVGMISMFALGILVLCGILFPESKLVSMRQNETSPNHRDLTLDQAYFLAKCPVRRYVKRRYKAWRYLLDGPAIIQEGYDQVSWDNHNDNVLVQPAKSNQLHLPVQRSAL